MALTNKFLLYDMEAGGFIDRDGCCAVGMHLQLGAMHSEKSAGEAGIDVHNEEKYLQIPLTQEFVDALPFGLDDADPEVEHVVGPLQDTSGSFIVLTEMGFFDEKYNSRTETSRPKVRGFALDYANLYTMEDLTRTGTEGILSAEPGGIAPIAVPVSEIQQDVLAKLPQFSPEKEPHGFFMKPLGDAKKDSLGLGEALSALEAGLGKEGIPLG